MEVKCFYARIRNMENNFFENEDSDADISKSLNTSNIDPRNSFENENNYVDDSDLQNTSDINPRNPFENFTEYEDYNSDYREIVPQIDIPGCVIPFEPSKEERRRIRHYFNIVGGGIFLHFLLSGGIMMLILELLQSIVMRKEGVSVPDASVQYLLGLENFFNNSSILIGINMLVLMVCSIFIFIVGSKVSKIKISSYFNTSGLTFKAIAVYCIISFFIRYIGGFAGLGFEMIFNDVDMSVGTEMMNYQSPKTILLTVVYTCLVAPIIEELMYRGFVMKNLSRVSQRFGIIMSALLFGLMHGNVSQFIFAFFMGLFLAHIDIKHNSLIPSILVHAFVNTFSIVISYSGALKNVFATSIIAILMVTFSIAGMILLIGFYKKNRLPFTMPHQKLRNGTAISSVMLIMSILIYTAITISSSFPNIFN